MASAEQLGAITPAERDDVEILRTRFPATAPSYGLLLDDALLCRYLRARNGNIDKATAMLTATLDWRRDFGLPEARGICLSLYLLDAAVITFVCVVCVANLALIISCCSSSLSRACCSELQNRTGHIATDVYLMTRVSRLLPGQ